jgi:hypothetical protein
MDKNSIQLRKEKKILNKLNNLETYEQQKLAIEEAGVFSVIVYFIYYSIIANVKKKDENPGFVQKLIAKIIINTQIVVNNVHIRYEDNRNPHNPIVVGVLFKELSAQSTDKNWKYKLNTEPPTAYKAVNLKSLLAYHDSKVLKYTPDTFRNEMRALIPQYETVSSESSITPFSGASSKIGNLPSYEHILEPSSMEIHMQLSLFDNAMVSSSKEYVNNSLISMEISISNLSLRVGNVHIPRLKKIADFMADRMIFDKFQYNRPPRECVCTPDEKCRCGCACVSKVHPEQTLALWRWAINCVYGDIHRKYFSQTWEGIKHLRED